MTIIYIKIFLIAYIIGAIPTTYIIVKLLSKKNITNEGSNNVGAMNSYEITGSPLIGILSFFSDFLKGAFAVYCITTMYYSSSLTLSIAIISVVLGHNYSIFLLFKGGRGLSTAAGSFAMINPFCIFLWIFMFFISKFIISRNVHIANVCACCLSAVILWYAPNYTYYIFTSFNQMIFINYKKLYFIVSLLIIISHIKPLIKLYKNNKKHKSTL